MTFIPIVIYHALKDIGYTVIPNRIEYYCYTDYNIVVNTVKMDSDSEIITAGKYVIIQRQEYTKLHKFGNSSSCASLGKDQVELANIENCPFFSTFKMVPKGKGKNRLCSLVKTDSSALSLKDNLGISSSGTDNRNITDDGRSQKLTTEEIAALRQTSMSSTDIVSTLISNSNTFHSKTEFSQDKYLKKKEKKYFEFVQIRKPSMRLIADIMYRQDPAKILGIRSDTLSQILSYCNVSGFGNHLLYDSGSSGLMAAAMLNSVGAKTEGQLVHMHPGNCCQKQALLGMNFKEEQLDRCISVNLYSVLRHYYQSGVTKDVKEIKLDDNIAAIENNSTEIENNAEEPTAENRKRKLSSDENEASTKVLKTDDESNNPDNGNTENGCNAVKRIPKWELENERVSCLMKNKVDSLVIVSKEHPMSLFKELLPFVKNSRPFVVYNNYQEPLQECYVTMRKLNNVTGLKLTSSWMRGYQVILFTFLC